MHSSELLSNSGLSPESLSAFYKSELFAGLEPESLATLHQIVRRQELAAGEHLFRLGEEAKTIFIIESGRIALTLPLTIRGTAQDITIEEKEHGAVIAWSVLIPPHKLTLGAHAVTDAVLHGIDRADLVSLFERQPRIKLTTFVNLAQVIASRLYQLEGIMLRDLQRWVTEKYA